jgi:tRNA dimethylallyltransferase
LYDRINTRVEAMLAQGFMEEVKSILERGYTLDDPGLNTVGYKQAIRFLNEETSREQMIKDIKTKTRRYAKRQLTYFRRWNFVHWLDMDEHSTDVMVEKIIQLLNELE